MTATASSNRGSLRAAIDAKCKDCVYDKQEPGGWRQQVAACPCEHSCPLWSVRTQPRAAA
ncbi:hypothetical protein DL238_01455 [Alteriqipengyuania lutimaris]|uniref:Uncharacterized protein n=1 Tax=Alteriqipengyuania lutimaris TaxID=1538146 RepID=A0A395LLS9_9SPHN|nr:hypothetical protein DL238_01455 [Alteriqipengyuania lutimaris]